MIITIKRSVKSLAKKDNTGLSIWYLVKKGLKLLDMARKNSSFGQDGVLWGCAGFLNLPLLCSINVCLKHGPNCYCSLRHWKIFDPPMPQKERGKQEDLVRLVKSSLQAGTLWNWKCIPCRSFSSCHAVKPAFNALWRVCSPQLPTLITWAPPFSSACSFWRRSISLKLTFGPSIPTERSCLIQLSDTFLWIVIHGKKS